MELFEVESSGIHPSGFQGICRKCHPLCKRCTGYGVDRLDECRECSQWRVGDECTAESRKDFCLPFYNYLDHEPFLFFGDLFIISCGFCITKHSLIIICRILNRFEYFKGNALVQKVVDDVNNKFKSKWEKRDQLPAQ